ncbi:MAG: 50S ribosomal protein L4 [Candidatus Moranbacteria bacterium]|nr:50S ribosomal protein L4 [Candidatus Moranbacteria bacterium]
MKLPVHNLEGEEIERVELEDRTFPVEFSQVLVHQTAVALKNNRRVPTAHTKTRGEVRGGGKKPWRQKGTGRARAGSIRSPLWRGGGITFGPRNSRNYKSKINKRTGKLALAMAIKSKVEDKELKVVENLNIDKPKTKELVKILANFGFTYKPVLLVTAKKNEGLNRASRNLPKVKVKLASGINMLDFLTHKFVLAEKEAIKIIEDRLMKHDEK